MGRVGLGGGRRRVGGGDRRLINRRRRIGRGCGWVDGAGRCGGGRYGPQVRVAAFAHQPVVDRQATGLGQFLLGQFDRPRQGLGRAAVEQHCAAAGGGDFEGLRRRWHLVFDRQGLGMGARAGGRGGHGDGGMRRRQQDLRVRRGGCRGGGGKVDDDARPLAVPGQQGELAADVGGAPRLDDQAAAARVALDLDGADDALGRGPVGRIGQGGAGHRDDDFVRAGKGEFVGNGRAGFQHQTGEILVQARAYLKGRCRLRRAGGRDGKARDKTQAKGRGGKVADQAQHDDEPPVRRSPITA